MSAGPMEPSRSTCAQCALKALTCPAMLTLLLPIMVLQVSVDKYDVPVSTHAPMHLLSTAQYPSVYFSLFTVLFALHCSHFTLHSSLFTLHSSLFTLHSSLFTLHSSLFTLHSSLSTYTHWTAVIWWHVIDKDDALLDVVAGGAEDVRSFLMKAAYMVLGLGDVYLGAPCAVPVDPR